MQRHRRTRRTSAAAAAEVVTHLRYDEIFSDRFITSLLTSLNGNKFEDRSIFGKITSKPTVSSFRRSVEKNKEIYESKTSVRYTLMSRKVVDKRQPITVA